MITLSIRVLPDGFAKMKKPGDSDPWSARLLSTTFRQVPAQVPLGPEASVKLAVGKRSIATESTSKNRHPWRSHRESLPGQTCRPNGAVALRGRSPSFIIQIIMQSFIKLVRESLTIGHQHSTRGLGFGLMGRRTSESRLLSRTFRVTLTTDKFVRRT